MTDIDILLDRLDEIVTYPDKMKKIRAGINGLAFFPGGRGLFNPDDHSITNKTIMILGQDFDTEKKYLTAEINGSEDLNTNKTWKNLNRLLSDANIPLTNCFFTNALMGVRLTDNASGRSPGFDDKTFVEQCQDFFLFQLHKQRPKVVFALGIQVAKFLSNLSSDLATWKMCNSFKDVDNNESVKRNVYFKQIDIHTTVVLLMHPSARHFNLQARKYRGLSGYAAQVQMVIDSTIE